jgi:hypothetical protein
VRFLCQLFGDTQGRFREKEEEQKGQIQDLTRAWRDSGFIEAAPLYQGLDHVVGYRFS